MFSLEIEYDADDRDLLIAELWEQGSAGIVELSPRRLRAFFEGDRKALLALYPGSTMREEEDKDWVQSARDLLQPMEVGERFYLVPEWRDDPTPAGGVRLEGESGVGVGGGGGEKARRGLGGGGGGVGGGGGGVWGGGRGGGVGEG